MTRSPNLGVRARARAILPGSTNAERPTWRSGQQLFTICSLWDARFIDG
jgi:hypothetical protein